jgi:hypothetical protein
MVGITIRNGRSSMERQQPILRPRISWAIKKLELHGSQRNENGSQADSMPAVSVRDVCDVPERQGGSAEMVVGPDGEAMEEIHAQQSS